MTTLARVDVSTKQGVVQDPDSCLCLPAADTWHKVVLRKVQIMILRKLLLLENLQAAVDRQSGKAEQRWLRLC
jgi:hypothetical protein